MIKDPNSEVFWACFGFLNGTLYLGRGHHMAIMNALLAKPDWDWEKLMNAEQTWGWIDQGYRYRDTTPGSTHVPIGQVNFSTDAGMLGTNDVQEKAIATLESYFGQDFERRQGWGQSNHEFAPNFDTSYGEGSLRAGRPPMEIQEYTLPGPNFVQPERQEWMPEGLYPVPQKKAAAVPRVAWIWYDNDVHMTEAHPNASHAELTGGRWVGGSWDATAGDFHLYDNGTARGRLLAKTLDLTDAEKSYIIHQAADLFRSMHPYHELTEIDDYTERGTPSVKVANWAMEPTETEIGGYNVIEMSSGEYPNHDAIMIDRPNKVIYLNYAGHHAPIFDRFGTQLMYMEPESSVQGHWRVEDSRTESFESGWGWHHGEADETERAILEEALKAHYKVDDLEHSFLDYAPVQTPEQPKLFEAKWSWLEAVANTSLVRPHPWKAIYNPELDSLTITEDITLGLHAETELQGFYTKVERTRGPHVGRAKELMKQALTERYPTMKKVAYGYIRWMIDRSGKVTVGKYDSHADLLDQNYSPELAYAYDEHTDEYFSQFVTGGYITSEGVIEIVRSQGEPEFNRFDVAESVYSAARDAGYELTGDVHFRDIVADKYVEFNLFR